MPALACIAGDISFVNSLGSNAVKREACGVVTTGSSHKHTEKGQGSVVRLRLVHRFGDSFMRWLDARALARACQ